MIIKLFLIIIGVSIGLSIMALTIILPFFTNLIKITKSFVCSEGSKMIIKKTRQSYHSPNERSIEIYSVKDGIAKDVKVKTLFIFLLILFLFSIPIVTIITMLIMKYIIKT